MEIKTKTIIGIIILIIIASVIYLNLLNTEKNTEVTSENETIFYQGPVPEGYDEEHFRETGMLKKIENNKTKSDIK